MRVFRTEKRGKSAFSLLRRGNVTAITLWDLNGAIFFRKIFFLVPKLSLFFALFSQKEPNLRAKNSTFWPFFVFLTKKESKRRLCFPKKPPFTMKEKCLSFLYHIWSKSSYGKYREIAKKIRDGSSELFSCFLPFFLIFLP